MDHGKTIDSPIGKLLLTSDGKAITGLYMEPHPRGIPMETDSVLEEAARQLENYFKGEVKDFDLPLSPSGTDFQRKVWEQLRRIPYGTTISYGELAKRIGNPDASRAVGLANGKNPIAVIIPCHRVIGANGSLVGFGGGLDRKKTLLELEGALHSEGLFASH